jgi:hypothetical protein
MQKTLLILFLLFSMNGFAQLSKLTLYCSNNSYDDIDCFTLVVSHGAEILFKKTVPSYDDEIELDSLLPGIYTVQYYPCDQSNVPLIARDFSLVADSTTVLTIDYSVQELREPILEESAKYRAETQFSMGHYNNRWNQSHPALTQSTYVGFSQSSWFSFNRHVGFLIGGGLGFTHSSIAKDTTFMHQPLLKKKYECYNYLDGHVDVRFRLTHANQQQRYESTLLTVDVGASYYFPFFFKHTAWYDDHQKLVQGHLHQYTDCRLFASIGYAPVLFFAEYRLFDFVKGGYPELPKYNLGIRIVIQN